MQALLPLASANLILLSGTSWGYAHEELEGAPYVMLRRVDGALEAGPYWWSASRQKLFPKKAAKHGGKGALVTKRPAEWDTPAGKEEERAVLEAATCALRGRRKKRKVMEEQPRATTVLGGPLQVAPGLEMVVLRIVEPDPVEDKSELVEGEGDVLIQITHQGQPVAALFAWVSHTYMDALEPDDVCLRPEWHARAEGAEAEYDKAAEWLEQHPVEVAALEKFIREGRAGQLIPLPIRSPLPPPFDGYEHWLATLQVGDEVLERWPGGQRGEPSHYSWDVITGRGPKGEFVLTSCTYDANGARRLGEYRCPGRRGEVVYSRIEPPMEPLRSKARREYIARHWHIIERQINALPLPLLEQLATAAKLFCPPKRHGGSTR